MNDNAQITQILHEVSKGNRTRLNELITVVYNELHHIAETENALGFCLLKMNDFEKGKEYLLKSYDVLGRSGNQNDPVLMVANRRFSEYPELF